MLTSAWLVHRVFVASVTSVTPVTPVTLMGICVLAVEKADCEDHMALVTPSPRSRLGKRTCTYMVYTTDTCQKKKILHVALPTCLLCTPVDLRYLGC